MLERFCVSKNMYHQAVNKIVLLSAFFKALCPSPPPISLSMHFKSSYFFIQLKIQPAYRKQMIWVSKAKQTAFN